MVPGRREVRGWWSGALPPARELHAAPVSGERVTEVRDFLVRTIAGESVTLRRRVLVQAGGRRRKEFELVTGDGQVLRRWRRDLLSLYGAEQLASDAESVVVTEGAVAARTLIDAGIPAVGTLTGALEQPPAEALTPLLRTKEIILWPDNDEPGVRHMEGLANRLRDRGVDGIRLVRWKDGPFHGDAADVESIDRLKELLAAAEVWSPRAVLLLDASPPRSPLRVPLHLSIDATEAEASVRRINASAVDGGQHTAPGTQGDLDQKSRVTTVEAREAAVGADTDNGGLS